MPEFLFESASTFEGGSLEAGVIKNIKVIGFNSIAGRGKVYPAAVLREAASLYNVPVNLNHSEKKFRDVQERFGWLENARFVEGDGIRADLFYNTDHPYAKTFEWAAKNRPNSIGLSQQAVGDSRVLPDGSQHVAKIRKVQCVDIVADPATTKGLFESRENNVTPEEIAALQAQIKTLTESNTTLQNSVNEYKAKETAAARRAVVIKKIDDAGIPAELKTEIFIESCLLLDDTKVDLMIADRKKAMPVKRASSRETTLQESAGRGITKPEGATLTVADFKKNWKAA